MTIRSSFFPVKGNGLMKTMTCKQLGGPCDFPLRGTTANEVIKAQDKHLKDMVAEGDATHQSALREMQGRWKNPLAGMGWYRKTKREFAALPED
jgi:predicted small metal-binding protein